jgi:hypothetical protein
MGTGRMEIMGILTCSQRGVIELKTKMTPDDLLNIEVRPFTRLVWNSTEAREKYEPLVQKAASLHDRAEYEMVRQEKRRCGTLHLYPHNYHDLIDRIQKDGMVWLPIQWTKNYHGFSHRHLPTVPGDPDSSCYGVIARNLEDAEAFRTASAYQGRNRGEVDHEVIAELLGFPACCAKFFVDKWGAGYYDPVWQSAEATEGAKLITDRTIEVEGNIHTHQMLRYYGFRTTSNFPCSLDCEDTIRIGDTWLEVMRSIDLVTTDYLIEILSMPLSWSCLHGVAIVETQAFTVITNSLPTKERWTVLFNVPGQPKAMEVLTMLGEDVDLKKIAVDSKQILSTWRR